jgi:putative PIN family toxin of toxin-antitoxin system
MIWVSYFLSPDSFRCQVLEEALNQRVRLFVSDYLTDEVVKSVRSRLEKGTRYGLRVRLRIKRSTQSVKLPASIPRHVPGDPDDDAIVETAIRAKADYLVSADHEVLNLKKVGSVKIITAAEFARLLGWKAE